MSHAVSNKLLREFLSKEGRVRVIDVGRSYTRFCEKMGGQTVVFEHDRPTSVNPFSGLRTEEQLDNMMPMLQDVVRLLAYPLTQEEDAPAFDYKLISQAIRESWLKKKDDTELSDVAHWLEQFDDGTNRGEDLALQLEQFTSGQYQKWFSGQRTVSFDNPLVVIELDELKNDPLLQAVILPLVMYQITTEMYLSDRATPRLLLIDNAGGVLSGLANGLLETAYGLTRKHNVYIVFARPDEIKGRGWLFRLCRHFLPQRFS